MAQSYDEAIPLIREQYYRNDLVVYCSENGKAVSRSTSLDSLAAVRCRYYLSILRGMSTYPLRELMDSIPADKRAHSRLFGKPGFFVEPAVNSYTPAIVKLKAAGIEVSAEVMQQSIVTIDTSVLLTTKQVVELADRKLAKYFGPHYILDGYMESIPHKAAIDRYGAYRYGTAVMALVRMLTRKKGYRYEVLFYNATLFGRPLK